MPAPKPQTKENHTRFDPPFHFVLCPLLLVLLLLSLYELVHAPGLVPATQLVLILMVLLGALLSRGYALKVQDRVIRLEERLRLATLSPSSLLSGMNELSERQLIALRFASDEELPALAQRAHLEQLTPKAIKASIRNWRPDYWRV